MHARSANPALCASLSSSGPFTLFATLRTSGLAESIQRAAAPLDTKSPASNFIWRAMASRSALTCSAARAVTQLIASDTSLGK
eukprot:7630518-Pyramimonas_sp.AAC.1